MPRCWSGSGAPRSMASTAPLRVTRAVPLPPGTVDGLMEQVVLPSEDGTLQVRATSEVKPPAGATVRLVVMIPPLGMETTGLATVSVKSGLVTVTGTFSVWVSVPLVAVMVTEPEAADAEAETVRVLGTAATGLAVAGFGFREQL